MKVKKINFHGLTPMVFLPLCARLVLRRLVQNFARLLVALHPPGVKPGGFRFLGIKSHFQKVDPIIYRIMADMEFDLLTQPKNSIGYFKKLCREIIAQQLASKAAHAIINRFYDLFEKKYITPGKVLAFSEQELRNVGMSWAKARYTRDLAQKVKDKEVRLNNLHNLNDKSVVEELIKVKGIGNWTAEMFLIFTLGRENVFSHGDLGLRKALQKLYGFKEKLNEKQINKIVNKWSPYKSYGCLALWRSIDKQN